jgi:AraC family transcriptional regulator
MRAGIWPELSVERLELPEGLFPEKSAMLQLHFVVGCSGPCTLVESGGKAHCVQDAELWIVPPGIATHWRVGMHLSRVVIALTPEMANRTFGVFAPLFDQGIGAVTSMLAEPSTAIAFTPHDASGAAPGAQMQLAAHYFSGMSELAQDTLVLRAGLAESLVLRRIVDPSLLHFAEIAKAQPQSEHEARFASAFAQLLLSHLATKASRLEPASEAESGTEDIATITALRTFVDERLGYDLGVDDLARNAQMSKFQLLRLMKKHLAQTPQQFVIQRRIEKAKQLLRNSEASLADIAFQTGFSSQSHLSNTFKQVVGNTPKGFRDGVLSTN